MTNADMERKARNDQANTPRGGNNVHSSSTP